ncbi:MAG: integrase core domain-containing protein [Planctomycetaceae bacterium]|nr:integrase core domain-containing protein [Planctomycetaceae bacterium]
MDLRLTCQDVPLNPVLIGQRIADGHSVRSSLQRASTDEGAIPAARAHKAALCSPNTCAFVERFIQTLQQECLDDFVVFGEKHMNHVVSEMVAHYHEERPHQAEESNAFLGFIGTGENENSEGRMLDWWPLSGTMHCTG